MNLFFLLSILLALTAVFGVINERFLHLQSTIGLMLMALLTTVVLLVLKVAGIFDGTGFIERLVGEFDLSEVLLDGVLCFMIFSGSAGVKLSMLERERWVVASLAFGSTVLACVLIGILLSTTLGWVGIPFALAWAFVFGALISPTDPIAALAILQSAGLPKPLETVINGESLFNDGVGVVLFTVALAFAGGSSQPGVTDAVALFVREVAGGVALGFMIGWITHRMLFRTREYGNQLFITLATVALGYSVSLEIDVSGPIAMVVAGLMVGHRTLKRLPEETTERLHTFWSGIDEVLNSLLFVMIGFVAILVHDLEAAPLGISILIAIIVCLLARAISVYVPLWLLNRFSFLNADVPAMTKLFTWGGLRGGLALALALSLPSSPEKPIIVNMTFGVVAFSILVQGSTVGKLFSASRLKEILK